MTRSFDRDLHALNDVFEFIDGFVAEQRIHSGVVFPLHLAVEELFTNMVKYNTHGEGAISILLEHEPDRMVITMTDTDSAPFDITEYEADDVNAPLSERKVGGLGIHLVQRMMDEVYYEHKNRRTRIQLVKKLNPSDASPGH